MVLQIYNGGLIIVKKKFMDKISEVSLYAIHIDSELEREMVLLENVQLC